MSSPLSDFDSLRQLFLWIAFFFGGMPLYNARLKRPALFASQLCDSCSYPRAGLPADACCPECGSAFLSHYPTGLQRHIVFGRGTSFDAIAIACLQSVTLIALVLTSRAAGPYFYLFNGFNWGASVNAAQLRDPMNAGAEAAAWLLLLMPLSLRLKQPRARWTIALIVTLGALPFAAIVAQLGSS